MLYCRIFLPTIVTDARKRQRTFIEVARSLAYYIADKEKT